jgi:hypothetical protein
MSLIGITPEMIDAGAEVISASARDVVDGWVNPDDVAVAVYRAMAAAREEDAWVAGEATLDAMARLLERMREYRDKLAE